MSQYQPATDEAVHGNNALLEKVTYPAFFEKLASSGISPSTEDAAVDLLKLGHVLGVAASLAVERILSQQNASNDAAVKVAADAAFNVAGLRAPTPAVGTPTPSFLGDPAIVAAAQSVILDQVKQAGMSFGTPPAIAATEDDEDEDEDDDKKAKAKAA